MKRRSFLQAAVAAVSALAIDPERLLWTPSAKTIFVPPTPRLTFHAILGPVYDRQVTYYFLQGRELWQWDSSMIVTRTSSGLPVYRG